ncbi:MAG: UDP-N-acetylmuramyl-tripeptide synthetase, partial [Neisseriaceae bacterium]|nr:UDP-N-acetylmuramyl-tripeptide synthetase [Neisseriaceae bacterium]
MSHTPFNPTPLLPLLQQGFASIVADSRQVQSGDVFIAYQGEYADGRNYIQQAVNNGAQAVVYQADNAFVLPENISVPCIGIENGRQFAGNIASFLLGEPSQKLDTIGVTGTNGKTSITQWLAQAFDLLGKKCAVIGTAGNGFMGDLKSTTHTTPDAVTVHNLLADFLQNNAQAVAMEVSSHGLDQYRVSGVAFDTAIFTNLTRDHLDYHGDMATYGNTKRRLFYFDSLKHAVINTDDAFGLSLYQELQSQHPDLQSISYGFNENADIRIKHFQAALNGNVVELSTAWGDFAVKTALTGRFNAQNLAAVAAVLLLRDYV